MAEVGVSSEQISPETCPENKEEMADMDEPAAKKLKVEPSATVPEYKLEERLSGILCCAVCLDLPKVAVYQCTNGHLMCAGCLAHLLADSRLKDEEATCPNCRCDIGKNLCTRNLAVEKAISEMPASCQHCSMFLPRNSLDYHERELCQERYSTRFQWRITKVTKEIQELCVGVT